MFFCERREYFLKSYLRIILNLERQLHHSSKTVVLEYCTVPQQTERTNNNNAANSATFESLKVYHFIGIAVKLLEYGYG